MIKTRKIATILRLNNLTTQIHLRDVIIKNDNIDGKSIPFWFASTTSMFEIEHRW